jgi:peptide/nickel transport system ATP-binding protein
MTAAALAEGPACEVRGLEVRLSRGGPDVVDHIDLVLHPGEIVGLVGESGSGKTTVGTALLAYSRRGADIVGGEVRLGDTDLLSQPPKARRRVRGAEVAYIPQDPAASLNPALRVGFQVREALDVHGAGSPGTRDARVREVLEEVALPSDDAFLRRYPHQLSGGQLQRVAIAMAFALRPKVLVLDEPTTGLDVTTQEKVLATVRDLCARHDVAALYVTHDLAVVASLAHRVAVMYGGQIVEIGPAHELFTSAAHPYTLALLDAIPSVTETRELSGIPGQAAAPGLRPGGCRFHDRCPYATDICRTGDSPRLADVAPDHATRCLRVDAVRQGRTGVSVREHALPQAGPEPVLEVSGVDAWHGHSHILHGIELAIGSKECVALVGESGSGKSTLSRCISGLHDNWTGTISYRGEPVAHRARRRPAAVRKAVQYIFQNPYLSLNPRRTVGDSIRRPLQLFGIARGREVDAHVRELLEQVALPAEAARMFPDRLSGGERQRVAIARALACEPDLLICDEITSALDVSVQASIVGLLEELREARQVSMLFVTHNLALVRSIANRTTVMQSGRIVESGATEQLLDHAEHPYTQELLANTPRLG